MKQVGDQLFAIASHNNIAVLCPCSRTHPSAPVWARNSYPTPRIVWMRRRPCGWSILRRKYKAMHVGDLITIVVAQGTTANNGNSVSTARTFNASSGISALAGHLKTSGVQQIFSPQSSQTLSGKSQGSTTSTLNTILAGRVVAVLPSRALVIEAERQLTMNNEKQTILVRGLVRQGDISPDGSVPSNFIANLELELRGKGVLSDGTRPPNLLVRALLRIVGF